VAHRETELSTPLTLLVQYREKLEPLLRWLQTVLIHAYQNSHAIKSFAIDVGGIFVHYATHAIEAHAM
jgi:hypothetical protein